MSNDKMIKVTSENYPGLIGKEFDISKGIYVLLKDGKPVAQSASTLALMAKVPNDGKPSDVIYIVSNGYSLMTPPLILIYIDMNGFEKQISCEFMVDTGSTTSGIPKSLQAFQKSNLSIPYQTCGGIIDEGVTKVEIIIDNQRYCIMAVIHKGPKCILGLDILKYYVMHLDGASAGLLIKNNLPPQVEEDVSLFE